MRPKRPLRSVFLGNPRYLSVYALGISQAMGLLGHWHRYVSIFDDVDTVNKQINEMSPDVIWTHMALWPPNGALTKEQILPILTFWKNKGTVVYLHDGDPRERPDIGGDVNWAFSIALVNRIDTVSQWNIPSIRWPYAAMVQKQIADPRTEWKCDLLFAGHIRTDDLYGERTALVITLQQHLGNRMMIVSPGAGAVNNRMLVADVAASAGSVLGLARPDVPGWIDSRCFQFPGAGGVLIHDDAGEFLTPDIHYLKFDRSNSVDSVLTCVNKAIKEGPAIREQAFKHVQANHTWIQRTQTALEAFYGR